MLFGGRRENHHNGSFLKVVKNIWYLNSVAYSAKRNRLLKMNNMALDVNSLYMNEALTSWISTVFSFHDVDKKALVGWFDALQDDKGEKCQ